MMLMERTSLQTSIHRKSTHTDEYLALDSHYPIHHMHKKSVTVIKNIVKLTIAVFMHRFHDRLLPSVFDTSSFAKVNLSHNYNTRLSQKHSYIILNVRTNYGKFNIRFQGPKV